MSVAGPLELEKTDARTGLRDRLGGPVRLGEAVALVLMRRGLGRAGGAGAGGEWGSKSVREETRQEAGARVPPR